MEVRTHIAGTQVEATTTLTFFNPNQRQLEGELVFPLPDGATVTGYALDVNGKLRDGVVVRKDKARVAFETEVRRGVDPGLVEQVAGNVYRTRIYPLPPQGVRKIRLRYVAELPANDKGDPAWHLPLPLGETVGKLAIRVEVAQAPVTPEIGGFGNLRFKTFENLWVAETEVTDAKPGEDLWVALPKLPPQVTALERTPDGDIYFALSDLPGSAPAAGETAAPAKLGIAWDASGSRSGAHGKELAVLRELLKRWTKTEVTLVIFRDRPEPARVFQGGDEALFEALRAAPDDGGTDFTALSESLDRAPDAPQWLLFTDGFDTLSGKLPDFGKHRVTALVTQAAANRELLRQVCADSGGQALDLQKLEPAAAVEALIQPAPRVVGLRGSGIAEVQGIGASAQGRVRISGKLLAEEAELRVEYSDGRVSPPFKLAKRNAAPGELVAAVWAAERVNRLSVRAEENEDELLALGRKFGMVSPATSLLVLENVDQYVRNDIEPPASEPELRAQWWDTKNAIAKSSHLQQQTRQDWVIELWKQRVAWWERKHDVSRDYRWKDRVPARRTAPYRGRQAGGGGELYTAMPGSAQHLDSSPPEAAAAAPAPSSLSRAPARTERLGVAQGAGAVGGASTSKAKEETTESAQATVTVKAWDPATPYLTALKATTKERRYPVYLEQRKKLSESPAFFLDCGEYFLREGEKALGVRILTNLTELKLEDAPLVRVLAWRLQQAGEFDRAVTLLRKAAKLRPEEPQSLRDLALALADRGKATHNAADLTEAMALLEKLILGGNPEFTTQWQRFPEIEVIALEELNALIAWSGRQEWSKAPTVPNLDERLRKNLDMDIRIVMSWDADATDVDLHVLEPSGQEAFFSQNRTEIGGLVSHDFTQGYGPEEYLLHKAMPGGYRVFTHYYGSRQQTVVGPATITATVFTDFGRATEKKQVLTLRLDKPREKEDMGEIIFEGGKTDLKEKKETGDAVADRDEFRALVVGDVWSFVVQRVGEPTERRDGVWIYRKGNREYHIRMADGKTVLSVSEVLPGGAEMVLAQ